MLHARLQFNDRWYDMFFTWMIAAQMWMEGDPLADPFRMAQKETAMILDLPAPSDKAHALPKDRKLVA